jgi:hypothetical protein
MEMPAVTELRPVMIFVIGFLIGWCLSMMEWKR